MEDLWKRAKTFAEEAAKKSQALATSTTTATSSLRFADLVSETAKKSKELATEASKKADQIKSAIAAEAAKHADSIKSISDGITIPPQISAAIASATAAAAPSSSSSTPPPPDDAELEKFGVTDDLRSFVRGLTSTTFQNFPISYDESEGSDEPTVASNVRKDLNQFQEKHATLVLTTVKEISRLRYELCPRAMKERNFWKIYFTLVNTHVAPYEKKYMEEVQLREAAEKNVDKAGQTDVPGGTGKAEATGKSLKSKSSNASSTEQDLDTFLLGDLEDSDEGPDDGEGSFDDDDFDKIGNSDVEDEKHAKKASAAKV